MPISPIYSKTFIIPSHAIDENGHVNNVAYVQWMHAESTWQSNIMSRLAAPQPKGRMLHELSASRGLNISFPHLSVKRSRSKPGSTADVERLRKSGEVTGDAYLARLKDLRAYLAENEAAFKAQGYPIKVETIQCPNCGGTLELGMDKCEYCGQVLLS